MGGGEEGQAAGQEEGQPKGQSKARTKLEEGIRKNKQNTARKRAAVPEGFEQWYAAYGKKVSREEAERAYAKAIRKQ